MNDVLHEQISALSEAFDEDQNFKYTDHLEDSPYYEIIKNRILEQAKEPYPIDSVYFSWLLDLSLLHFEYAVYSFVEKNDRDTSGKHLNISNGYGYACLYYGAMSCGCFAGKNPFIIMNKAAFMMCNLLLCGHFRAFEEVADTLIGSLNGNNCIIKRGYQKGTISWFIIKLYSLYSGIPIKLDPLFLPNPGAPYDQVLNDWDSEDPELVEKYTITLCDTHLAQASIDYATHREEDIDSLKYRELFTPHLYAIPFEIIYWFKLRSLKGLECPKVDHPLMDSLLARLYDINFPDIPNNLPFVDILLKRISAECDHFTYSAGD